MAMKNDNENEANETNELFIEELGEVRGGLFLPGGIDITPITQALNEDGPTPRPFIPPKPLDPIYPGPSLPKPPSSPLLEDGPLPRIIA